MKSKNGLTRRGFIANTVLGAVSIGIAYPSPARVETGRKPTDPLRLHRNESPYGLPPGATEAVRRVLGARSYRYPIEEPAGLVDAIAKRFGVAKENVLLGCGSIEILKMATEAFCNSMRAAVVAEPTFEAVAGYCPFVRARSVKIKVTEDYKHDLSKMLRAAQGAGMVFFCNPSNPTGTFVDKRETERLVRRLPRGTVLLADEAYGDYVDRTDYESCLRYVKQGLPVVVSRTFSKIYGMAGLRVGYAIGRKDLIERMAKRALANNPNQLATAAALAALKEDAEFVDRARKLNAEVRDYVCREVKAMGLSYIPSETNFVMIGLRRPAESVIEGLKKRNVLVGRLFPSLPEHVRVSFGTMEEMKVFLKGFKEVLTESTPR